MNQWTVITHPCLNVNGGLAQPVKWKHWWVIIPNIRCFVQLFIHAYQPTFIHVNKDTDENCLRLPQNVHILETAKQQTIMFWTKWNYLSLRAIVCFYWYKSINMVFKYLRVEIWWAIFQILIPWDQRNLYMRQKPNSALVKIMACRLIDAKPSSEPKMEYC